MRHSLNTSLIIIMNSSKYGFLHLIKGEIEEFYKIKLPECKETEKSVFILSRYFFGIYKKKLYVDLIQGEVVNYKISHYIFNRELCNE